MKPRYLYPKDYYADPSANVFNGKLYVYPSHDWEAGAAFDDDGGHFQMKDYNGVFHLGVAIADKPEGPFIPQEHPIRGSFSIDPSVFKDDDGQIYT